MTDLRARPGLVQGRRGTEPYERTRSEDEEQFRMAFEFAPIGQALVGLDGRYEQVNRAMCELTGYSEPELRQLTVADLTDPHDTVYDVESLRQLVAGDMATYSVEKRYVTATGDARWATLSVSVVRALDGSPQNFIQQIQDITERKQQEDILADERRRLRATQSIGRIGSWEMNVVTRELVWSDILLELHGIDPSTFDGDYHKAIRCIHPDDRAMVDDAVAACAATGAPLKVRHRVIRVNDGELRWVDAIGARHDDGQCSRLAGAIVDVTEQVLAEARLEHAALHDALTGLPNRRLVVDRLGQALDRSEREGLVAVLFCDLDGFKRVNDRRGHHAGDAVLIETAARLVAATRSGDTVGRMGGDEFVVICGVAEDDDAATVAHLVVERIERAMSAPIKIDGVEHRVTIINTKQTIIIHL